MSPILVGDHRVRIGGSLEEPETIGTTLTGYDRCMIP